MFRRIIYASVIAAFLWVTLASSQTPPKLTAAQWQADVRFLAEQMPKQHPNLFRRMKEEDFEAASNKLYESIPAMSEDEVVAGLMKLVALVNDGHTNIFPASLFQSPVFPVRFYLFEDGLFIQRAAPAYAGIVGAKVIRIGDLTAQDALKLTQQLVAADNEMGRMENGPLLLSVPTILAGSKISGDRQHLKLVVEIDGKQKTVDIAAGFTLTDLIHAPADWADARASGSTIPLYVKDLGNLYWFEYLKDQRLMYVQQNGVVNKDTESVGQFYTRVMDFVAKNPVDKFVLDLRNNDGGNNALNRQVVIDLIKSKVDERGKLFVITGRRTFSAAQNFVNELEKYTNAIFVGEPTAGHPNHYGDNRPIELPNSKLRANVSTLYWQDMDPRDDRKWTPPEIATSLSAADYRDGRDPALDAIVNYRPDASLQGLIDSARNDKDIANFVRAYDAFKADPRHRYVETEATLNRIGYALLQQKRVADAIEIFKLNVRDAPNSANAFDSLGDGYVAAGKREEAIKAYEKALALDPSFASSAESLKKLKGN